METVTIHDKKFELFISSKEIQQRIGALATKLNNDLVMDDVIFIVVLNGSFMFASDILKKITFNTRISFMKLSSYNGTETSGNVRELIGINEVLKDKTVVILEDIVESGNTLNAIIKQLWDEEVSDIKVVSLLLKPDTYEQEHKIDYAGFKIGNDFVVGYGLDYDGFGRNLESIYKITE